MTRCASCASTRLRRLPVCDKNGAAVGIVSLGDLSYDDDADKALADISAAAPNA